MKLLTVLCAMFLLTLSTVSFAVTDKGIGYTLAGIGLFLLAALFLWLDLRVNKKNHNKYFYKISGDKGKVATALKISACIVFIACIFVSYKDMDKRLEAMDRIEQGLESSEALIPGPATELLVYYPNFILNLTDYVVVTMNTIEDMVVEIDEARKYAEEHSLTDEEIEVHVAPLKAKVESVMKDLEAQNKRNQYDAFVVLFLLISVTVLGCIVTKLERGWIIINPVIKEAFKKAGAK